MTQPEAATSALVNLHLRGPSDSVYRQVKVEMAPVFRNQVNCDELSAQMEKIVQCKAIPEKSRS